MTLRAAARGKDYRMVEEAKQPASDAAWRAEMARHLRRGAGDGSGSLAFVNAEESAMLADVLEQGCPGEGFMALPVAADGEPVRPGQVVWLLDEGDRVVITDIQYPPTPGVEDGQAVTIECETDSPFELIVQ